MPKVKQAKRRKGRSQGAPEETNRFRAAYKKSVKLMQDAIGAATGEAKFPGIQTGNGYDVKPPPPPERERLKNAAAVGATQLDTTGVDQDIAWQPQPGPQTALLVCPVEDIFFGGARGGASPMHYLGTGSCIGNVMVASAGAFFSVAHTQNSKSLSSVH